MLNYNGKELESLDFQETLEFEKELMTKLLAADKAEMSESIIKQIKTFIQVVGFHKEECLAIGKLGLDKYTGKKKKKKNKEPDVEVTSMNIGENDAD
jgi:Tat protein secretion system quality control protein TatD with DNase activity